MNKKHKLKNLTDREKLKIAWTSDSENLHYCKTLYYAAQAVEYHGSAVRDNSFSDLVAIGKEIEKGVDCE
jgi:hypothetical protein